MQHPQYAFAYDGGITNTSPESDINITTKSCEVFVNLFTMYDIIIYRVCNTFLKVFF